MDNKLRELSTPVGYFIEWQDEETGEKEWCECSKQNGAPLYSQEYVSALLEKLKEKDERAIACVNAFEGIETDRIAGKSLGEFLAGELYLNKAEPKQDGSFGFTFSGLAVQLMADCFADQFKSSGAINYLELLFEHAEVGEMTVTMQRVEGLTPAQKLAAAEQRIAELEAKLATPVRFKVGTDSVDYDVSDRNQPGMVVAVHVDAGDFVKVKGQVYEVKEACFDDHDVTLWFVCGEVLKCAAGCQIEVVSAPEGDA